MCKLYEYIQKHALQLAPVFNCTLYVWYVENSEQTILKQDYNNAFTYLQSYVLAKQKDK